MCNKYPFTKTDDEDIIMDTFNSSWPCGCQAKTQKYVPSLVSNEYKLILNNPDKDHNYDEIYLEDFDENFDLYHSLKPEFKGRGGGVQGQNL